MTGLTLTALFFACASRAPAPPSTSSLPAPAATTVSVRQDWTSLSAVRHLNCDTEQCVVVLGDGAWAFQPDTLELVSAAPMPELPEVVSLSESLAPVESSWNQIVHQGWRSPFTSRIPTPDGGRLTYVRGIGSGGARVVRSGGGIRTRPAPDVLGTVAHPRWLALHQTGNQAYLVTWPHSEVIAFDPSTLATSWRADMDAPAVGLFIDPTGRYLVIETGGKAPEHQLLDYSAHPPAVPEGVDPYGDPYVAEIPRPTATHTVVVDLQSVEIALDAPGSFRAWTATPDSGALLATSKGIGRLP